MRGASCRMESQGAAFIWIFTMADRADPKEEIGGVTGLFQRRRTRGSGAGQTVMKTVDYAGGMETRRLDSYKLAVGRGKR